MCLVPSSNYLRIHAMPYNCILGIKGQWSWCSAVSFISDQLQHGHPVSCTYFHLYLMSFVPQKTDTKFTIQSCKRWVIFVIVFLNPFQSTRSKALMYNIPLSYRKVSVPCDNFSFYNFPHEFNDFDSVYSIDCGIMGNTWWHWGIFS